LRAATRFEKVLSVNQVTTLLPRKKSFHESAFRSQISSENPNFVGVLTRNLATNNLGTL
jgi:hypothetical protein